MKTEKKRTTKIILAFAFFLLIAAATYGDSSSPPDFNQETPMTKLPIPVDFSKVVYAEASKTVSVSFWTKFDKQSKERRRRSGSFALSPSSLGTLRRLIKSHATGNNEPPQ
jgi:hypothetical protein